MFVCVFSVEERKITQSVLWDYVGGSALSLSQSSYRSTTYAHTYKYDNNITNTT